MAIARLKSANVALHTSTLDFTPETTDAATYFAGAAPLLAEVEAMNP
jgi:hypothetical protein